MNLDNRIRHFIESELMTDQEQEGLKETDSLVEKGVIDSLGIMNLVAFIEEELGIHVPPEDVTLESFSTIATIVTYLEGRKSGGIQDD